MFYVLKVVISAILIVLISEIGKRSSLMGAVLASLPLVSFLAIIWMYIESKDVKQIVNLSTDIFWLVLPSLFFFILFPILLKRELNFWLAFGFSAIVMIGAYLLLSLVFKLK
jgi:hypothetical protein